MNINHPDTIQSQNNGDHVLQCLYLGIGSVLQSWTNFFMLLVVQPDQNTITQLNSKIYLFFLFICRFNEFYRFSYDPEEDRWTLIQPMHSKRLGVGVAVVNRLLYVIGGFDGKERLSSIECYHPENNEWSLVAKMHVGRSGSGKFSY